MLNDHAESVLEGYRNLKSLMIENYVGTKFPTRVKVSLPCNLVQLELHHYFCQETSCLGHLQILRNLVGFHKLECLGPDFYGVEVNTNSLVFPLLKRLVIKDMPNLTEWMEAQLIPTTNRSGGVVKMFPVLEELLINESTVENRSK